MQRTKIKVLLTAEPIGQKVCVKGWVKTKRVSKHIVFITLDDGSTIQPLQVVVAPHQFSEHIMRDITSGTSLHIEGAVAASVGQAQSIELQAEKIQILGPSVAYPLQPKKHSLEFLREIAHLRFRTRVLSAVFRVRHAISYAIHQFFHERGFVYLHTPIITGIDAEGAGAMFNVTTLDIVHALKTQDRHVDFSQDFFGQQTNLTVSGQLEAEAGALGLGEVYTFGPTFRAEYSNTTRHLAEFWMVEPEMAFYDLADSIALAEEFLKYVIRFALDHCRDDLVFLQQRVDVASAPKQSANHLVPLLDRLEYVLSHPFACISYTEAIDILRIAKPSKQKQFVYPIQDWGNQLQSEHERYLVEHHFQKPVVVTDYPRTIKAFYMRQQADGQTVACMDILFPGIGEIIGGSQREERLDKLEAAMQQANIDKRALAWYLDTRRFGTVPHSGFGLGLERLVQFVTGMENIRDVIPFPRTPGNASF